MEALVQKTVNDALTGNVHATRVMLAMINRAGLDREIAATVNETTANTLSKEDRTILARYLPKPQLDDVEPGKA